MSIHVLRERRLSQGGWKLLPEDSSRSLPLWWTPKTRLPRLLQTLIPPLSLLLLGYLLSPLLPPPSTFFPFSLSRSPPFLVQPRDFIPPEPYPPNPAHFPEPLQPRKGEVVPRSVHYVYGLKPWKEGQSEGEEFPYYAYLAVRSVIVNIKPDKIYFHHHHLPSGPFFALLLPHLTLLKTPVPEEIYGKKLRHFAHQSDVIRLNALLAMGGIYLDIDTYVLRDFKPLLSHPTTLAMEMSPQSQRVAMDPEGLCNAIIIAAPHASFLERWRASYESFDEGGWAQHSVQMPWTIARRYPSEIQVLNNRAFFWPMWHGEEVQKVHERDDWDFKGSGQFAYHAWESLAMKYLEHLSPMKLREETNSFNRMARAFIGPEDDEVWQRWKGGKG